MGKIPQRRDAFRRLIKIFWIAPSANVLYLFSMPIRCCPKSDTCPFELGHWDLRLTGHQPFLHIKGTFCRRHLLVVRRPTVMGMSLQSTVRCEQCGAATRAAMTLPGGIEVRLCLECNHYTWSGGPFGLRPGFRDARSASIQSQTDDDIRFPVPNT